jgi:serine/threonine-protein kinase
VRGLVDSHIRLIRAICGYVPEPKLPEWGRYATLLRDASMTSATPESKPSMAEVKILCPICHKPNTRTTDNYRTARFCQHCGQDVVLNNNGPRYYITRIIKEGGQGAVYQAIDDAQRVYAVKEMLDRFTDPKERAEALDRFKAEAQMLMRLVHPRIPRVYASFEDEDRHYLVMDFVRGEDLEDVIRRRGSLPEDEALAIADQMFDVIEYLHRQRPPIIFRDMKPSNIMIESGGSVKVIDFGIAKMLQGTNRGTQIGTPGYAPPEQYQGMATVASDVYSLGATLHHMMTGRDPRDEPPFSFPPVYGLKQSVSRRTSEAVQRALQMKPEDRWSSVAEFRKALRPAAPQPAQVRVAPGVQPAAPQVRAPAAPAQAVPGSPPAAPTPAPRTPPLAPTVPIAPAGAARPAAPPAPAQSAPAKQQPARRRGFGWLGTLAFGLVVVVLIGATLLAAFPNLISDYVSLPGPAAQPTQQVLIQRPYSVELEVVVPPGGDVRAAFVEAYRLRAQAELGPQTQVNTNVPLAYVGGDPQQTGQDASGTKYRATVSGYVLVPPS